MIVVATGIILAIAYGFFPKPVPVDLVKVARGPIRVTIEEEGKTRVKDRYTISAPVAGFMQRLELEEGDPVKKGQALVRLESLRSTVLDPRSRAAAEAEVLSAEAALLMAEKKVAAARADEAYAKSKMERFKKLYEGKYIPKNDLELTEAEAQRTEANRFTAEAAVKVAQHDLERARTALRYSPAEGVKDTGKIVSIHSPVAGRVLNIHRKSEGVVQSGEGLIDIGDPHSLEVRVEVLSANAVHLRSGTPVLFERWGGDSALLGKVRTVEPAGFTKISSLGVEEQRVPVIADITSLPESWKKLGEGYRVEARFIIWEGKDVLQIPASALFRKGENWAAFVVKNGKAKEREVKVGHRTGLVAEVLSGLVEHEEVIAHPDDSVKDGSRVRSR
ncbi:MAG: efflux RND transporter periplasmic adaptor subunit [Deltaproteobacteria bacterium]|nr:efflux RND transporter periplasmic adaptor subunit [Deltaproteobacteria bacterium]